MLVDGGLTPPVGVGRAIYLNDAAHADLGGDFIGAEARAGRERHSFRGLYEPDGRAERITLLDSS